MRFKPPKTCYFCNAAGDLSKEHVWPQWMRQLAPALDRERSTRTLGFARTALDSWSELPTEIVTQPGDVLTARVREVCRSCNNGWMSRLEQHAQPILSLLADGRYALGSIAIPPEDAAVVARWALKCAWMRELATKGPRTPTSDMRLHLKEWMTPPPCTRVWAARYMGQETFASHSTNITLQHHEHDWEDPDVVSVQVCSLTWSGIALLTSGIALLTRTDDRPGAPPMQLRPDVWTPLWPGAESVTWPQPNAATDADVLFAVVRVADWASMPDLPRFERHPMGVQHRRRN
jgi:hypothetical protein